MTAKTGRAPCGHPGTYVTNTFITCDFRCEFEESDGVPIHVDPERTLPLCKFCGSDAVAQYGGFVTPEGLQVWHCHNCEQGFAA